MSSIIPALLSICDTEWKFFGQSRINSDGTSQVGKREYDDGAWQRIGDYWKFINGPYKNLNGKDRGTPWSAAFISWCMNEAGAGKSFPYSAGHATYINASIRDASNTASSLIAKRIEGYKIKPGDLIGYWRGNNKITIDNALKVGWYESHTDVIVEVGNGKAFSIGGNVLHSVTKREVRLNSRGELSDKSENWFVIIQNNL